jgi:hypothetical protein
MPAYGVAYAPSRPRKRGVDINAKFFDYEQIAVCHSHQNPALLILATARTASIG